MLSTVLRAAQASMRTSSSALCRGYRVQAGSMLGRSLIQRTASAGLHTRLNARGFANEARQGNAPEPAPPSNNIYVGNLPYDQTEQDLRAFFGEWGTLTRVALGKTPEGAPKGFAHIEFADIFDAKEVKGSADEEPFVLGGRNLVISYARQKERRAPIARNPRIFFSECTSDKTALYEIFADFKDDIVKVEFFRTRETGENMDRGFITFKTTEIAEEAIHTLNGTKVLDGREVKLRFAHSFTKRSDDNGERKEHSRRPRSEDRDRRRRE